MLPKLSCYQFKVGCYNFKKIYVSLVIATREKRDIIKKSNHTGTKEIKSHIHTHTHIHMHTPNLNNYKKA